METKMEQIQIAQKDLRLQGSKQVGNENRASGPEVLLGLQEFKQCIWYGSGPMYPMIFPTTLQKSAKDQTGTIPVHLAKGVVIEARGKEM